MKYALHLQSKEGGDLVVVAISAFIHDIHRIMGAEQHKFVSPKESLPVVKEFLNGIDLTVNKGDVISIIGPSGCGKSTLLRCINLLEIPCAGENNSKPRI